MRACDGQDEAPSPAADKGERQLHEELHRSKAMKW